MKRKIWNGTDDRRLCEYFGICGGKKPAAKAKKPHHKAAKKPAAKAKKPHHKAAKKPAAKGTKTRTPKQIAAFKKMIAARKKKA